jgi:hypothetical protein
MNNTKLYRILPDAAAINTIETRCFRVGRISDLEDYFEWQFRFKDCPLELEEFNHRKIEGLVERLSESTGMLCFSKEIKNPILWSHHADGHKGIAFEVNEVFTQVWSPIFKQLIIKNYAQRFPIGQ